MATEAQLTDKIQRIKTALLALGDLRPGALSEQYHGEAQIGLSNNGSKSE